jgi:hypothetical protein
MKTLADVVTADGKHISLAKLAGKKIVDVKGTFADPFGGAELFLIHTVVLEDGSELFVGGEHDCPYIEDTIVEDDEWRALYDEAEARE